MRGREGFGILCEVSFWNRDCCVNPRIALIRPADEGQFWIITQQHTIKKQIQHSGKR